MAYVHPLYLRSKPRMQFRHRHWREGDRERERERERDRVIGCGWWFCFNRAASSSSSSSSKSNQTTRGCSRNCSLRLKEARRLRRSAKAELVVTELNKCLVDWFKRPVSFFDAQNAEFELKGLAAGADSREMVRAWAWALFIKPLSTHSLGTRC
ncbi:hypothetical protein BCR33DRAFT_80087 [Rhizoclosmatium globosum]|uniref:Uncharacterized protein n=1 Tax=Rhizoclosmatium globosum TaxID=329046 RepID=A0A1Y2CLD3_9FUNG|nr:hypothetical protein BCR33DRAFT_80087 [Rhizoclosmatium globosum]|eukprot:ORY47832.1 hypothetical protein BCR33DRAFT_80087 [Rhizoclosmatium globosum]